MLAAIAQLRYQAGSLDDNPRFRQLVGQLTDSSAEFRSLWDTFGVTRSFYRQVPTIIIDHPIVGSVRVSPLQLIVALHPGLHVSVHLPSGPEDRAAITRLVGP